MEKVLLEKLEHGRFSNRIYIRYFLEYWKGDSVKTINDRKTIEQLCDWLNVPEEDREWILKPLVDVDSYIEEVK